MGWEPEESWRVRVSSNASPPYVALEMEKAPASGQLQELARLLGLAAISVERGVTSGHGELGPHLTRQRVGLLKRWAGYTRGPLRTLWNSGVELISMAFILLLAVSLWLNGPLGRQKPEPGIHMPVGAGVLDATASRAPVMADAFDMGPVLAYPMPGRPFSDQAKPPCRGSEVLINGGCWVALEKRPPCNKDYAEYQGKCYLPISARSHEKRTPQSIHR
jgi:hypothetical protein